MKTYRTYLNAIGRRPLPKNLRTTRRPGDVEIVRDAQAPDGYKLYRHEEADHAA